MTWRKENLSWNDSTVGPVTVGSAKGGSAKGGVGSSMGSVSGESAGAAASRDVNPGESVGPVITGSGVQAGAEGGMRRASTGGARGSERAVESDLSEFARSGGLRPEMIRTGVRRAQSPSTETVLGANCSIRGRLDLQGRAQIDGNVEGEIVVEGELVIGPTGVVKANILATQAIISGRLTGDIRCEERLELRAGAYLTGDIAAPQVVMEDGVVFDGRCWMDHAHEELEPS